MSPDEDHRQEAKEETEDQREELLQRISDWLDIPMAILAVIWAMVIVLELAVPLPPDWLERVAGLNILIWLAFLSQFLLELVVAPNKLRYLRSHWLVAISVAVPFFRVVRIVRAIAALRGISLLSILLGANRATRGAAQLFTERRFQYVAFIDAIAALVGAAGVYFFERDISGSTILTFGEALWWSATLVTTINISPEPVSFEGRIIAFVIRMVGLATFGYVTASIASYLVGAERAKTGKAEAISKEQPDLRRLHGEIAAMRETLEELTKQVDRLHR